MSQKELQRLKVIENAVEGKLTVAEAAVLLGISRQVKRYKARFEPRNYGWVLHGNDGRQPHNRCSAAVIEQVAALATGKYKGSMTATFGTS